MAEESSAGLRRRTRAARIAYSLALLAASAGPSAAIDGVIEIDALRAVSTGIDAGDAAGYPVTITKPGSYRLTSDLVVQDVTAIEVSAENVAIDLNGFTIRCATTCTTGHGIYGAASGLRVRNGSVRGMGEFGVRTAQRGFVEHVDASYNAQRGVSAASASICRHVRAVGNGWGGVQCPGILVDSHASANGRNGLEVIVGVAARNESVGNGTAPFNIEGNGLRLAGGVAVGNTIVGNGQNGIRSQQGTVVLHNAISANADWGLFHEGFGNMGFVANAFEANADGTLNCIVGAYCPQLGANLCDGSTVCP